MSDPASSASTETACAPFALGMSAPMQERVAPPAGEPAHIPTAPPLQRTSIAPSAWPQSLLRRVLGLGSPQARTGLRIEVAPPPEAHPRLKRDGALRRAGIGFSRCPHHPAR